MNRERIYSQEGHLMLGNVDSVQLAKTYGTPLYVFDTEIIREKAAAFKEAFSRYPVNYQIAYASKAFSTVAMVQLVDELGLALDVVSGGELYTALSADYPAERIHFHGNNKSEEELRYAVKAGIGAVIVDNFYELDMLSNIAREENKIVKVMLRITPGVEADTHAYISTGQEDSKFGFYLTKGDAEEAFRRTIRDPQLLLIGLHFHIGSQLFTAKTHEQAIQALYEYVDQWYKTYQFLPGIINVGGGFGIRYTESDLPETPQTFIGAIVECILRECEQRNLKVPEIWIEPGRALVGEAGTTLYTVGSMKSTREGRTYIAVDGGMTDNLRPALYQSKYEAAIANRFPSESEKAVTVAGKCCESGDILIDSIELSAVKPGDLLAVFCTGAYGYAMANNYNRLPRPAVVFVEAGEAQLVVKRESYEDLIRHDLPLKKRSQIR
ncbi:diaminopimelate decarboxylase [Tuberibacillus calidus]|uniref:diaminopimelate decarboxylase n=1 Tax=Tuberibacillus calidus TaxID=340097 RepID=UPI000486FAA0|nr:diaminopimelate decarboxylase [Tuberibacillus calidus]